MEEQATFSTIQLSEIDFGNRHRQDYGNLEELASDIKKVGLIHPITVIDKEKAGQDELSNISNNESRYLLVAGGRRFKAYEEEEIAKEIPAYVYPRTLSHYELRKIELMENVSRKEMTWQEEAVITAELHDLEQKIKGKSITSAKGGHSLQDTADVLGKSKSSVKNEVDLAKAMELMPHLKDIKNKTEAIKVAKQLGKTVKAERKAKRIREEETKKGSAGIKKDLINSFVLGDFFEHAERLPQKTFDLIEIDPPYGIDLANIKKEAKHTTLNYNEVPSEEYEAFLKRTFLYAKKLLKPDGWLVCWYAIAPWHTSVLSALLAAGFKTNGLPGLWIKNGGQTMRPKHYFGSCYEPFFYARLGEGASLNKPGSANYLVHPKVAPGDKVHPTQRPVSLMEDVLERFVSDGKVLVPFAGSGVTLRAAHNKGLKAIGYDLSKDAKNKHDIIIGEWDGKEQFRL